MSIRDIERTGDLEISAWGDIPLRPVWYEPTLANKKLEMEFPARQDDSIKKAIDILKNPKTEADLKFVREFGALQSALEWGRAFQDCLFDHINEVPKVYRERISATIHHEINSVLGSQQINSHDDNFAYIHDLKSVLDGDKTISQVGERATRFYGGHGVFNAMLLKAADELDAQLTQQCADFVEHVAPSPARQNPRPSYSME